MSENFGSAMSRRRLLTMIGLSAGGTMMYQAMHSLGLAAESGFQGPIRLSAAPKGASVLVLGAGIAGLVAAYELRNAGYQVQVLEYNGRAGGRNWTLRGGDRYTELGGEAQECRFDPGLYINPGPWRLPYHHRGMLSYCKRLGVALEPFVQVNHNAYLHEQTAFGGKPQRLRAVKADYDGHIAELLAKATQSHALDAEVSKEDQAILLDSLRSSGALDKNYRFVKGPESSDKRGFDRDPGGGLSARPIFSEPVGLSDLLRSRLWGALSIGEMYDMQTTMFQPVGGMGRVGEAFGRELKPLIRYNAKVVEIHQDESGVTVTYEDTSAGAGGHTARADWCVCTIPLSILGSDTHERRRTDGQGDRRGSLLYGTQGGPAVQTSLLGGGRANLRRHHLHRLADRSDQLPKHRLFRRRQRRAARRIHLEHARFDGVYVHDARATRVQGG